MLTWKSRISDLQDSGLTRAEIAEACGMALSTLGDIASGWTTEPRGDAAVKLHELHKERCKKKSQTAA